MISDVSTDHPASPGMIGNSSLRSIGGLLICILICFAASGVGVIAVNQTLESWYVMLRKPSWNPPNWLFGPVWTSLYTMMAVSAWLIWRRRDDQPGLVRVTLAIFAVQLTLNALWSWVFFAWRQPGWGFLEVLLLWAMIVATIAFEWRISRPAALLMVPYLGWVTFAAALNATIWRLNS